MNVLVVGSSLIDFFVQIEDNDKLEIKDNKVILPLGAKFPIDIKSLSLGGNGANVSSALNNLSIKTSLYTYLGNDPLSKHIREKMEERHVELIIDDIDTTTGSLSLIFDFPTDRIIFSHHNFSNYDFDKAKITTLPDFIFLTSIGNKWEDAYEKVVEYADSNDVPIAFSPGSQQLRNMNETFLKTVKAANILMCNMDEAKMISEALGKNPNENVKNLLLDLKGDGFDILSITDGANGAYAVDKENNIYKINSIESNGHEKTGAGDAYAGAFLAAYLLGNSFETALKWGVLNAIGEMKQVGAGTGQLTLEQIERETANNRQLEVEKL